MDTWKIRTFLLWCTIINFGLGLTWFVMIAAAGDLIYEFQSSFVTVSREHFDATHYAGMTLFKISVYFFNIVPLLALLMTDRSHGKSVEG